ncbi:MAG: hypothetical protein ABIF85_04840 [Nanoarchaeota archaeon]|nr:hypothetical protein [Nanoarchaeota archaeon]MBU4451655.1 hypothetical protein [Nanoarchaeota archaeon]
MKKPMIALCFTILFIVALSILVDSQPVKISQSSKPIVLYLSEFLENGAEYKNFAITPHISGDILRISYDVSKAVSIDIIDSFATEVYAESIDLSQNQTYSSCPNISTAARNIETNECGEFSSPCAVPMGWSVVPSCEGEITETGITEVTEKPAVNESNSNVENKTNYIKYILAIPILAIIIFAIVKAYEQYSKNKTPSLGEKNAAISGVVQKYNVSALPSNPPVKRNIIPEGKNTLIRAPVQTASNTGSISKGASVITRQAIAENKALTADAPVQKTETVVEKKDSANIAASIQTTANPKQDDSEKYRLWFEKSRLFLSKSKRIGSILDGKSANEYAQYLKVAEECIASAEANLKKGQISLMEQDMKDAEGLMDAIYDVQKKI